jgi:uncharacterized DUF497 family protein
MYDDVIYKGKFVWNRLKNDRNKREHQGISFETASGVFDDPFGIEEYDTENSVFEDRYTMTGYLSGRSYLTVAFTLRENMIRLFSAREADMVERGAYNEHLQRYLGY